MAGHLDIAKQLTLLVISREGQKHASMLLPLNNFLGEPTIEVKPLQLVWIEQVIFRQLKLLHKRSPHLSMQARMRPRLKPSVPLP